MGQVNIRVPDDKVAGLRERLKAVADGLGVSQAEAVERGLERLVEKREAVSDGDINRWFRETWKRLEDLPREILEAADARRGQRASQIPSTSVEPDVMAGFWVHCQHCGNQRARGATKFATICIGCKHAGHCNETRECPVCTLAGTGAI